MLLKSISPSFSMHEWVLAEAIIKTIIKVAEENSLEKVIEVKIKIGKMQQIDQRVFNNALSELKPIEFRDTVFNIDVVETMLKCRFCGYEWFLKEADLNEEILEAIHFLPEVSHSYVKCPKCRSPDFEIIGGRGVWVESVRGIGKDESWDKHHR